MKRDRSLSDARTAVGEKLMDAFIVGNVTSVLPAKITTIAAMENGGTANELDVFSRVCGDVQKRSTTCVNGFLHRLGFVCYR